MSARRKYHAVARPVGRLASLRNPLLMLHVLTASCAGIAETQPSHGYETLQRVEQPELGALLRGATMRKRTVPQAPPIVEVNIPWSQTFWRDGSYVEAVETARSHGTYEVRLRDFCVHVKGRTPRCQALLKDSKGNLLLEYADTPAQRLPVTMTPNDDDK